MLARLSPAQRAGQLFIVGIPTDAPAAAARQAAVAAQAGGVLLYGGGAMSAATVTQLTAELQADSPVSAAGVRMYVAADQEGGAVQELSGPGFAAIPPGTTQGRVSDSQLTDSAVLWGRQMAGAGVNVDLAPVADTVPADQTASNQADGRYGRELGSDPGTVASHVVALVRGLQSAGVAATLKHFPGIGRVQPNTDLSADVVDDATTSSDPFLQPFVAGVGAGARFVMVSLVQYRRIDPSQPAAYSPAVITGLLRDQLHYAGLVVSDDLGAAAAAGTLPPGQRAAAFVRAGGDLVVIVKPASVVGPIVQGLITAQAADPRLRGEVDAAALLVLRDKERAGLLRCPGR